MVTSIQHQVQKGWKKHGRTEDVGLKHISANGLPTEEDLMLEKVN